MTPIPSIKIEVHVYEDGRRNPELESSISSDYAAEFLKNPQLFKDYSENFPSNPPKNGFVFKIYEDFFNLKKGYYAFDIRGISGTGISDLNSGKTLELNDFVNRLKTYPQE